MDLLYFVILVSALIFVHELGHYAWAKIFGVKVITFSLGFGPKILRLRGKETEYCVGLVIDGEEIGTYAELARAIQKNPGRELSFKVFRNATYFDVAVTPEQVILPRELDLVERVGQLGIYPNLPRAVIGVPRPDSPAYRAGLRTFDLVILVGGKPVRRFVDLELALRDNRGENMPVTYLRPRAVDGALGGLLDFAVFEPGVANLTPDPGAGELFARTGIELPDLYPAVVPDRALRQAGIMPGDKITDLD